MADIGIDLGTTNSAVAYLRNTPQIIENQGEQVTPSVVAWDEGEMVIGKAAKDLAMVLPSVVSVKRHMGTDETFALGGSTYGPEDVSAMILQELKKAAEEKFDEPVDSAVITIPAYFHGAQKEATKRAGEKAGFKAVRLLAEPIAAALAYGAEDTVLVYDLGGGTFDVAIIDCFDYKMLGLDGDNYLGGDDFDNRLITHVAEEVKKQAGVDIKTSPEAMQLAKSECERAKKELSQRQHARVRLQTTVDGTAVNLLLKITREQFEEMIADLVDRTIEKVEGAIAKAKEKDESFTKDDIDTVLLVGGSTYVPVVQRRLAEYFGREPSKKVNADLAVAMGAALHTASGPTPKGVHKVRLDPVPEVTAKTQLEVKGRTSPGATVEVRGGATSDSGEADGSGRFTATIELAPDKINHVTVTATGADGEERKAELEIRHDTNFTGTEEKRRKVDVGGGVLPRALGIRVTGEDDRLGTVIPGQTDIPCSVEVRDYGITSQVANAPGQCLIEVYEGELAYAPLNTLLASLMLQTAASPSTSEPLEITFQVTEDHLLTVTARMVNFPDRVVTARVKCESPSGGRLHVIERAERMLNQHADQIRPDDKAKLSKARQALLDLSEQHKRDPQKERYDRIKQTGLQLKADLDRIEAGLS